jgi:hypothetical protein
MDYRGIDFDLKPVRAGTWNYRFQMGRAVKTGKINAVDQPLAILRVQKKISREIRVAQTEIASRGLFLARVASMSWSREFEDPIPLRRGRDIITLQDAADYILKLPKIEQSASDWQAATEALIMAAENRGPLMHARIGVLRALNRNVERTFDPDREDGHWGKRKLKRDLP